MNELFRKAWQEAIEEALATITREIHERKPIIGDLCKSLNDEPHGTIVEGTITPVDTTVRALPEPKSGTAY